jgi:transposase-like protein
MATKIKNELVDELLKDADPKKVFSSEGLLTDIKKALAERMLNAEMDQHLEGEVAAPGSEGDSSGNHRNGYSKKTVITDTTPRHSSFPPSPLEEVNRWQSRPLDALYAIVFFDACG